MLDVGDEAMDRVATSTLRDNGDNFFGSDFQEKRLPKMAVQCVNMDFCWAKPDWVSPEPEAVVFSSKGRLDEPVKDGCGQLFAEAKDDGSAKQILATMLIRYMGCFDTLPSGVLS